MSRSMKDSGIEWIGEIPSDWEVSINKTVLQNISVRNHPDAEVLSLYRDWGVVPKNSRDDNHNVTSEKTEQYKFVEAGDLVINKMKAWQGSLAVSEYEGIVSPAYYVCKFKNEKMDKKYIHHLLRCCVYAQQFECLSTGMRIGQWDLSIDDFLTSPLLIPSLNEQKRISNEIDKKCSEVDILIANQQKQIETLKQYKHSMITEVVTKGLNPDVEMKDSGVEGLGKINSKFKLLRLKQIAYILDEFRKPISAEMRNQEAEVLYDYYGASGVIDQIDGYTIDDHVMLIGEDGANLRMRNLPLMYEVNGKAWINNHAHIIKPKSDIDFYYLFYALEALDINPYITGSAQPKLNQENLKNIWLPIPTISEQVEIAEYIKKNITRIESLIVIKQHKIEKLNQYKKSVIYEYVTGKKEA